MEGYPINNLPEGIRSRFVDANGLHIHILEAGDPAPDRPCILLLHGFPELAFSWRQNMLPLAELGFHVIAPDLRGCGRTEGWKQGYDVDLHEFGTVKMVTDAVSLMAATIRRSDVHSVFGCAGSVFRVWCFSGWSRSRGASEAETSAKTLYDVLFVRRSKWGSDFRVPGPPSVPAGLFSLQKRRLETKQAPSS